MTALTEFRKVVPVVAVRRGAAGALAEVGDRVASLLLHLTVAAVVVPLLYRTAASSRSEQPR